MVLTNDVDPDTIRYWTNDKIRDYQIEYGKERYATAKNQELERERG